MTTLKEANEALDYLQGRIDAGSMAGERLAVISAYLKEQRVIWMDALQPTQEETTKAHAFFAEVGTVKVSDHVEIEVGPITAIQRAERRAPSTTITLTGNTLTFLPTLPTFEELRAMHNDLMARSLSIPKPYNTTTDFTTHACANCIEQGIIQPGCDHD